MSPENTHKLMGFYMEGLILGVNTMYRLLRFFKLFLIGCIGLNSILFGPATTVLFVEVSLFQRVLIRGVPPYLYCNFPLLFFSSPGGTAVGER